MTAKIQFWFDPEMQVALIASVKLNQLTGPEYVVKVRSDIGDFDRFVCKVHCMEIKAKRVTRPAFDGWADTTTGSLYKDGKCLSGALEFVSEPKMTGRNVPNTQRRNAEAYSRANMVRYA